MTFKQSVVTELKKQQALLNKLIVELESKERLEGLDCGYYDAITRQVEHDLKDLRRMMTREGFSISNPKARRMNP
ncbi:MAG: hypothetical protein NC930_03685 [Candidatus Omnitrophica bacterium]|nr:hypothetical protein [Candidatus Omnitrophota bacterium]